MPAFFLTFLACVVASMAGRDALRVARLSAALGPGPGLFLAIALAGVATSAVAAWLGSLLAPTMTFEARLVFAAIALAAAAIEPFLRRAPPEPSEPTRSTGAILLVLVASLATDAVRFLVLAFAAVTAAPLLVGAGGALATLAVLFIAAAAGRGWDRWLDGPVPRVVAALLLLAGAAIPAWHVFSVIG